MAESLTCLAGALLPRTLLRVFSGGAPPEVADPRNLLHLQTSAFEALGCPKDVLEQAKCVVDNSETIVMGQNIGGSNMCHPRERREGLGRKRARFSLNPVTSLEASNVQMKLNIEHLADPEEYFAAFEKFEIADKELKKLRGQDCSNMFEQVEVAALRKHRPGILGRTRGKRSFQVDIDGKENEISSLKFNNACTSIEPEVSIDPRPKGPNRDSTVTSQDAETAEMEILHAIEEEGSIAEKENRVGKLLDNLLSSFETLDDDDGAALLQEQLQLKKVCVDKLRLPTTPVELRNALDGPRGQKADVGRFSQKLTPHKGSPLATIPLLHLWSSQMDSVDDPYSCSPPNKGLTSPVSGKAELTSGRSSLAKKVDVNKCNLSESRQDDMFAEVMGSEFLNHADDEGLVNLCGNNVSCFGRPGNEETVQSGPGMIRCLDKIEASTYMRCDSTSECPSSRINKNESQVLDSLSEGFMPYSGTCVRDECAECGAQDMRGKVTGSVIRVPATPVKLKSACNKVTGTNLILSELGRHDLSIGERGSQTPNHTVDEDLIRKEVGCVEQSSDTGVESLPITISHSDKREKVVGSVIMVAIPPVELKSALNGVRKQNTDRMRSAQRLKINKESSISPIFLLHKRSSQMDLLNNLSPLPLHNTVSTSGGLKKVDGSKFKLSEFGQNNLSAGVMGNQTTNPTEVDDLISKEVVCVGQSGDEGVESCPRTISPGDELEASNIMQLDTMPECSSSGIQDKNKSQVLDIPSEDLMPCPGIRGQDQPTECTTQETIDGMGGQEAETILEDLEILNDRTTPLEATISIENLAPRTAASLVPENQGETQSGSQSSQEGKSKEKTFRRPKGKSFAGRKSLADAGTKWESGLRRSTRNRMKPLEFWRGEKLLYARIHDSLTTVIGMKYSSPGSSTLKVKSFVSDDYADLLERVSLH